MRKEGLEPTRPFGRRLLRPVRLPIPPLSRPASSQRSTVWAAVFIAALSIPAGAFGPDDAALWMYFNNISEPLPLFWRLGQCR